jgi:hypothetical protein
VARLYDLAALAVALVAVGAILSATDIPTIDRAAGMAAIIGALLVVASMRGRNRQ